MNGHHEWTRLASNGGGDGVSPKGERGISPRGDARHNPRDYVFRIALIHIHQCAHVRGYLLRRGVSLSSDGSVVFGVGERHLMPSRESRSATCSHIRPAGMRLPADRGLAAYLNFK